MKETKRELRFFTIAEWDKEEEYLRMRHREGWKFVNLTVPGYYHFEKCTPEDVIYQLDYNEEGLKHKEEYVQMFRDCGWEYLQDYAGYSYFRKPVAAMKDGEEAIFCDDESRLDMMHRVLAGRYMPLLIILVLVILPNLYDQLHSTDADMPILFLLFFILLLFYLWVVASFLYRYMKLKNRLGK